ncbi:MAG: hypothetical protein K2K55_10200 [Duncaniella sp.]|nr:hypothetical protein [Duncaniella sp.]
MKKIVLVLAVAFSASLFACGSKEKAAEATEPVVEEAVVEEVVAVDSAAADTAAVVADSAAVAE